MAKKASEIRISDILSAVGESYRPVDCVKKKGKKDEICERIDRCVASLLWDRLGNTIKEFLDGITLEDLCVESREKWGEDFPGHRFMFHL